MSRKDGCSLVNQLWVKSAAFGVLAMMVVLLGCGGDATDGSNAGSAGSGTSGTDGQAGMTGGSGGSSGASGNSSTAGASGAAGTAATTGGAGGTTMSTTVPCGTATCEPDPAFMGFQLACCVDDATSTCGTMFAGFGMCAAPVDPDPRCESVALGPITIPSCCADGNRCGISAAMLGMGCTSIEDITAMFPTDDGGTAEGDGGTADGGTDDGGAAGTGGMMMGNPLAGALPEPKACE